MRLGVLDVGSNTVHLLVVDAHRGARPLPAFSHKAELRLGDHLDPANRLSGECTSQLRAFVDEALRIAEDKGVQQLLAFATSAVRDAVNGDEVLARIEAETKVHIQVLPGRDESRLTFLAARRWFGWSSGRLLMLDIGGGSLEIASGYDEEPDVAISLPLGGGRLTRDWLARHPPSRQEARHPRRRPPDKGLAARRPAIAPGGAAAAQACPGRDRGHRRGGDARGAPAPRGGDIKDIQAASEDGRSGAVQRRPVCEAHLAPRRCHKAR